MMSASVLKQLHELRVRLLWSFAVLGLVICGLYAVKAPLLELLLRPLTQGMHAPERVVFSSVPELFFVYLKIATWGGLFLTMPFLMFQIWKFLAPGLYMHERRWVGPLFAMIPVLFYTGGIFAYLVVLPLALNFFLGFEQEGVSALPNVSDYLGTLFNFSFAFGLAFNLPVFLILCLKMGLFTVAKLRIVRRFAIVGIFIASAILTPPDPFSQLFLALPLIFLYELTIWLADWMSIGKGGR